MFRIWFNFPPQNISYKCYISDGTLNTKHIKLKCLPEERHLKMVDTMPFKVLSHGFDKTKQNRTKHNKKPKTKKQKPIPIAQ